MAKTQASDATKVGTPVCINRFHHHSGTLVFRFEDGHELHLSPGRMRGAASGKKVDYIRVQLTHFLERWPKGEYGSPNIYGEKTAGDNVPLVKRYVEATKTFVDREKPKGRDERWSVKESKRIIKQALKFEPKSPAADATKAK